jgi:hypothetical protein
MYTYFEQRELKAEDSDLVLTFGPLSTFVSKMFLEGYYLTAMHTDRKRAPYQHWRVKVYLCRGKEKYLVGYTHSKTLAYASSLVEAMSYNFPHKDSIKSELATLFEIHAGYRRPRKKLPPLIGNISLREWLQTKEMQD